MNVEIRRENPGKPSSYLEIQLAMENSIDPFVFIMYDINTLYRDALAAGDELLFAAEPWTASAGTFPAYEKALLFFVDLHDKLTFGDEDFFSRLPAMLGGYKPLEYAVSEG